MDKQRFPSKAASSMVRIKDGLYISRNDPNYHKKVLHYRPSDQDMLYGYARKLDSEGKTEASLDAYKKAAAYGHAPSIGKLAELRRPTIRLAEPVNGAAAKNTTSGARRSEGVIWPYVVSVLLILVALVLLLSAFLYQKFIFEKTEYHYHYGSSVTAASGTGPEQGASTGNNADALGAILQRDAEQLQTSVLYNALDNYRTLKGVYPESLDKLAGGAPDNWISFIPEGVKYESSRNGAGYSIQKAGLPSKLFPSRLELQFYPEANRLGLAQDGRLLVLYPVASGSEGNAFPYKESSVTRRVVDPNGGQGALGTRGLELTEGFAIHGTNDEDSIGRQVTKGCLRLYNRDMEALYPYVALGTPYKVMSGKPQQTPLYEEGLPPAPDWSPDKEKTPGIVYHWRS